MNFRNNLGQIGRHTREHGKAVAIGNVFPRFLEFYICTDMSQGFQTKSKKAVKDILEKYVHLPVLGTLLYLSITKYS